MDRPTLLVDQDIPWGIEAFEGLGRVVPYDAADLRRDPSRLAPADVLACRSVTRVDGDLLRHAPRLRAIATPVVGLDHVVCEAVREAQARAGHRIEVFSAPGSTAGGVADWVIAAILAAFPDPAEARALRVGIWGFGNCGMAVAGRLSRLGIAYVAHDPPKEVATAGAFVSARREDLLRCDVVSLHVPLTGAELSNWPTRGMVDEAVLGDLGAEGVRLLCNTSRGPVIEAGALDAHLRAGRRPTLAVDVYEGEPTPDPLRVSAPRIATAHVAGSVLEGRRKAVAKVRDEVRRFLRLAPSAFPAEPPGGFDRPAPFTVPLEPDLAAVRDGIRTAVPLDALTASFRQGYLAADPGDRAAAFETARKGGLRREIRWTRLRLPH